MIKLILNIISDSFRIKIQHLFNLKQEIKVLILSILIRIVFFFSSSSSIHPNRYFVAFFPRCQPHVMQQVAENGCSTSGGQSRVRALLDSYLWALDQSLGLAIILVNRLLLSVSSECKSFFSVVVTLGLTTVGEHHLSNVSRESIDVSRDMRATEGRLVSF